MFAIYVPTFLATVYGKSDPEVINEKSVVSVKQTFRPGQNGGSSPEVVAEEAQIRKKIIVQDTSPGPWKILLLGLPSAKRVSLSVLTFLINAALVGLTVDNLYRSRWFYTVDDLSFVRLGYVSPTEAKFLVREPDQSLMPVTLELHIKDAQPPLDNTLWRTVGGIRWTSNETDFTGTLTVPLSHSKQRIYEWRTSNNHSGEFMSPPWPGHETTYNDGKFTFLSTSCILPQFPYNPLSHPLAIPGLRHLAKKLPDLSAQFMLFLGDFIYADVPQRFGKSAEEYRMQYRQVYASPDWASVAQNLSWIHVLDDHEISNNWSSNKSGVYQAAVEPWHLYHANLNPPQAIKAGSVNRRHPGATWYEFVQGPASFFMMDTRSYRSSNSLPFEDTDKTMLGENQLADFLAWLARPEPRGVRWKFVASSVPFTKNWPIDGHDTWGGFLAERRVVLEAMWDAQMRGYGVVILSGDRHEFAATKFPPPPDSKWPASAAVYEFSTSPLNQFAFPLYSYKQKDDEDVKLE
jgi:alkaline phosphatase D